MLKHIDSHLPELFDNNSTDLLKTRINCYADCYGFDKSFVDFWCGNGAVISRFDDSFTVWADESADYGELKEFLCVIGAKNIVAHESAAKRMGFNGYEVKYSFEFGGSKALAESVGVIDESNIRAAYSLVSSSIPGSFGDDNNSYMSFLSDFKYRQNRNRARGRCITEKGDVAAVAFTAAETERGALLSAIACSERYRGSGYGKKLVLSLTSELLDEGKRVFVIALNNSAAAFYRHIGFEEKEKIAFINLK